MDPMEYYIYQIPDVLMENISRRGQLTKALLDVFAGYSDKAAVIIVASGSSYNGACCARHFMQQHMKRDVRIITPFEYSYYHRETTDDLYLFVSQSGSSTNILRAIRTASERGRKTILLTAKEKSAAATAADQVILYGAGEETVGYVTKGVSTLILFLMLFALGFEERCSAEDTEKGHGVAAKSNISEMEIAAVNHLKVRKRAQQFCLEQMEKLVAMKNVFMIGCGSNMGTVSEGALKLSEMLHVQTSVYEAEEFLHGPDLQLTPDYTLFFIDGGDEAGKRVRQIHEATLQITNRSYLISARDYEYTEETLTPLFLLAFFQYLAYRVAKEAGIRKEHPLYERYEEKIAGKVEGYTEEDPF